VITTPFGFITNYVATVEVKISFGLLELPGGLPDCIFDLHVSGTPGDPFVMQSTRDLFGWTDFAVGTMPGYTITVSDTKAGLNPVRFYGAFSAPPTPW